VLGIHDGEHEETAPSAPTLVISRLACSLVGKTQTIKIVPGSHAHQAYGRQEVTEQFSCNYGLNPGFRGRLEDGHLKFTGIDLKGEARIAELSEHPFYVATLFLPQISSRPDSPHPLIVAYLKAALAFQTTRRNKEKRGGRF
jgi:CTP synthase (UTP-ammonia lyase)